MKELKVNFIASVNEDRIKDVDAIAKELQNWDVQSIIFYHFPASLQAVLQQVSP